MRAHDGLRQALVAKIQLPSNPAYARCNSTSTLLKRSASARRFVMSMAKSQECAERLHAAGHLRLASDFQLGCTLGVALQSEHASCIASQPGPVGLPGRGK